MPFYVKFKEYVGFCPILRPPPGDQVAHYDYEHYYRFGRGEKRLASKEKFPTHRQKRNWRWVFSFQATAGSLRGMLKECRQ